MKIAVDLQGADNPAVTLIDGVIRSITDIDDLSITLCGDKVVIDRALFGKRVDKKRLQVIDAEGVVKDSDDPVEAFNSKKNSSLYAGMNACAEGKAEAFVTCGSTDAMLTFASALLHKISDPVLIAEVRKANGAPFCIADCGANIDCPPEKIVYFARMAKAYMKASGIEDPRICLLSSGAEDGKGNAVTKKANGLLRDSDLNFIGNCEGGDVLINDGDIIACEGFAGNILLKAIEGSIKAALGEWNNTVDKMNITSHADDLRRAYKRLYNQYDYTTLGGGVLLGFNIPIIKGRGTATGDTIYHIIKNACSLIKNDLITKIESEFSAA